MSTDVSERLRCPRCGSYRAHTLKTFDGVFVKHTYPCGTELDAAGSLRVSNERRCPAPTFVELPDEGPADYESAFLE